MRLEVKKNAHPNVDGSPWGWIEIEGTRVTVLNWSGLDQKKYADKIVYIVNSFDDVSRSHLNSLKIKDTEADQ